MSTALAVTTQKSHKPGIDSKAMTEKRAEDLKEIREKKRADKLAAARDKQTRVIALFNDLPHEMKSTTLSTLTSEFQNSQKKAISVGTTVKFFSAKKKGTVYVTITKANPKTFKGVDLVSGTKWTLGLGNDLTVVSNEELAKFKNSLTSQQSLQQSPQSSSGSPIVSAAQARELIASKTPVLARFGESFGPKVIWSGWRSYHLVEDNSSIKSYGGEIGLNCEGQGGYAYHHHEGNGIWSRYQGCEHVMQIKKK